MKLKVVLKSRDEGGFKAYVPALPNCFSNGLTEDEVLEGIEHSILFHFGIEEVSHSRS
ncbi:MAG: type II toxin-antitoxin system HicB family antitoxin [Nitrospiria bacterium]